jgi:hypothetical protein
MAQKNEVIGHSACPLCGFPHQEVRISAKNKPYMSCDECGAQIFSRQAKSVTIMRKLAGPAQAAQVAKPAPVAQVAVAPVVAKPAPTAQAKESTIFDGIAALLKTPEVAK